MQILFPGDRPCLMSFIYSENKGGNNTVSRGTHERTGLEDDVVSSTRTCRVLLFKKHWIYVSKLLFILACFNFRIRPVWSTLSKTLDKSKRTTSICCLLLRQLEKSLIVVINWVSQLCLSLNPSMNHQEWGF